ncbi:hypothetical protein P3T76_003312 [Phytophthora citrophthora]|uniref:PX domain-containing protein n=1 Tax=Phytophthora citrophthora TaxID=4793 RepID=A0AAD9GUC8_9STRA|nr:hypothetical protein P3T76_003312 [Phytophthora citrophthora]
MFAMDMDAESSLHSITRSEPVAMTEEEEKSPSRGGGKKQLVACRIEGHKIQKRLSPKKKALDPLRYLPDSGGYYALFTIAAYFEAEGDEATERRHVVQRSYKQFSTLHSRLLKTYPKSKLPKDLPSMRNKRYDNEYIEEKRNELTRYMAQLMQIPEVKASNVLLDFLEASTAMEDSSDDEEGLLVPSRMLEGLPGTIVTVRAGQSFSVTLPLGAEGDVASWQFTTKKHNIGFSATFEGEMIRAYSREGADVKPIKGFYRCTTPGTCTLTWDNTYTWSKAKVLIYWAEVEAQNGTAQQNGQRPSPNTALSPLDLATDLESVMTGSGSDAMEVDNRRMGFIEHSRSNSMHPRHLVNSSISLLSKPFVHGNGGNEDGNSPGKTRHLIPRRTASSPSVAIPKNLPGSERSVKAGSLIIQRSVKFRGRNWYRKWFVLNPRKCVLRYYDSEAAARRGLSLAKLNLTNKHASLAITSSLSLDAAPTAYMFLIRTKKHCWKICAPSQSEYNEWENAISTAILTAQLSRRSKKSKKAMLKAAKASAPRKNSHSSESEDETPKAEASTDTNGSAMMEMSSTMDPDRPLSPIEESDDDDDDFGHKDDGDSEDDDDDESESDSDDELHEDDDIEVVQPIGNSPVVGERATEVIGSLSDLQDLPQEWKLGLAAVLNVALLSVRSAPPALIVLVLFVMDWYLFLQYMKRASDNELSTKPKAE